MGSLAHASRIQAAQALTGFLRAAPAAWLSYKRCPHPAKGDTRTLNMGAAFDPIQTFYRLHSCKPHSRNLCSTWPIALVGLDPSLFDNWPPFLGISFSHHL
jgi:hypothetical protein